MKTMTTTRRWPLPRVAMSQDRLGGVGAALLDSPVQRVRSLAVALWRAADAATRAGMDAHAQAAMREWLFGEWEGNPRRQARFWAAAARTGWRAATPEGRAAALADVVP